MDRDLIQNIRDYKFLADDHLLLDANVWLYTFGPSDFRSGDKHHIYNDALTEIVKNNCKLYLILPILSEYIYRYLDKQLRLNGITKDDLKAFRKTDTYKDITKMIEADVNEILNLVKCCNTTFENGKAYDLLDEFLGCVLDFNDVIIEDFCKSNPQIRFITNDGDFKNCSIPIITANKNML